MSDIDQNTREHRSDDRDVRRGQSLAARGAYGGSPPNMRDMERLDMLGAGVAALMILGPLFMGAVST